MCLLQFLEKVNTELGRKLFYYTLNCAHLDLLHAAQRCCAALNIGLGCQMDKCYTIAYFLTDAQHNFVDPGHKIDNTLEVTQYDKGSTKTLRFRILYLDDHLDTSYNLRC